MTVIVLMISATLLPGVTDGRQFQQQPAGGSSIQQVPAPGHRMSGDAGPGACRQPFFLPERTFIAAISPAIELNRPLIFSIAFRSWSRP